MAALPGQATGRPGRRCRRGRPDGAKAPGWAAAAAPMLQ